MTRNKIALLSLILAPLLMGAAFQFGGIRHDITSNLTSAFAVVLSTSSTQVQRFTGSTAQVVKLPDATGLRAGYWYTVINESTAALTVSNSGSTALYTLAASSQTAPKSATFYVTSTATAGGPWSVDPGNATSGGSGGAKEYWQGYHAGDCYFGLNSASYGVPDPDSTCTFTERFDPFAEWTVTSTLSGSDKTSGITFTPPSLTYYVVCAKVQQEGSSGTSGEFQLWDNNNSVELGVVGSTVQNVSREAPACGLLDATGGGSRTLYIRTKSSGGATFIGGGSAVRTNSSIEWIIQEL